MACDFDIRDLRVGESMGMGIGGKRLERVGKAKTMNGGKPREEI